MKAYKDYQPGLAGKPVCEKNLPSARNSIALAISAALMTGIAPAYAADEEGVELDKMVVQEKLKGDTNPHAEPDAPYKAKYSADERRTRPIAETPQTMTVLTAAEIEESGRSDLREILDGVPGITLGTGENGNAFGDRYVIRGHEARSDVFVDGLRDPGMTIRESFAVDQIEVSKGPSSSFAGRGTTGGAVNSATKQASTQYDFTTLSAGVGTDAYHRLTVDSNMAISDDTALRINLLNAYEEVPDRAPADRDRVGAAVSLFHQANDKLELTGDYYHLDASDKADLGTYIENLGDGVYGDPIDDIPVYLQNEDFLKSTVDTFTLRAGYEASPTLRVINLARYGTTDNGYVLTGARGRTAYPTETDAADDTNGYDTVGLSTHNGWQQVEYFADQLNFVVDKEIGEHLHELIFTAEYSDQKVLNGVYTIENAEGNCWVPGRGANPPSLSHCIYDENGDVVSGINDLMDRDISKGSWDSDWHVRTVSVSAMDTVDLTDKWTVFGGLRLDHYDLTLKTLRNDTLSEYEASDELVNGHAGVSYKIRPNANVYFSYSTATNINGGESDVGTSSGYGGFLVEEGTEPGPENTVSLELGTKWNLMDEKLLATAAIFRITKDDVMEGDGYEETGTANSGKNQVQGIEFGLVGNLSSQLSVQAGITVMNAEVLESSNPENIGKTLANFADRTASLQMRYQATPKFAFGGGMTYESERYTGQPDSAANEAMEIPAYTIYDAFASYAIEPDLSLRMNIGNLTDEDYYLAAYRSGSFTYKGDGRTVRLTLNYDL